MNAKEGSLSGMELAVSRLEMCDAREGIHVGSKSSVNDALNDFGDEVEVRDGPVTRKVVFREVVLFKSRQDKCVSENIRKTSFSKR